MLIDEIDKQSTTWTVDFVDSKPHYKTPIILTSAAHCACLFPEYGVQNAVGSMQSEVYGPLNLKSDYYPPTRKSKIEI